MKINIKLLNDRAMLPTKATDGSAMYDIYVTERVEDCNNRMVIWNTGLVFEVPQGYVMKVYPRSSTFKKYGLGLANEVGIIDSDYRGELKILTKYDNGFWFPEHEILPETRLAQFEIVKQGVDCDFNVVDILSSTDRGIGGFGSTG